MEKPSWAYKCSICGKVIEVDDVSKHTDEERAKPTWPGYMNLTRVDRNG